MAIRVEVYTSTAVTGGTLARSGTLREVLSSRWPLELEDAVRQGLDDTTSAPAGSAVIAIDDILFAVADDEAEAPVHAAWHHVVLDSGPFTLEGELATLPGFDPARSLARPSGEFVLLRDVRLSLKDRPEAGVSVGDHALINRYAVERIEADLMLGFFFPGATLVSASIQDADGGLTGDAAPTPDSRPLHAAGGVA